MSRKLKLLAFRTGLVLALTGLVVGCGGDDGAPSGVDRVTLTCASTSLNGIGATVQCNAVATNVSGNTVSSAPITFSSSNDRVATVNQSGLVTAIGSGSATITAVYDDDTTKRDSETITVTVTHVVSVTGAALPLTITPDPVTVRPRDAIKWIHTTADTLKIDLSNIPAFPIVLVATDGDTVTVVLPIATPTGDYKYSVTVVIGGQSLFQDPRVIVEEEGGGN
jgi:hypothetical protein